MLFRSIDIVKQYSKELSEYNVQVGAMETERRSLQKVNSRLTLEIDDNGEHTEYQVIPRLDAIMFGVLAAFISFYYPKLWENKWNIILCLLGLYILRFSKFHMGISYGSFNSIWNPSIKSIAVFMMLPFLSNLKKGLGKWTIWITFFSLISYSMYLVNLNVVTINIIKHTIHGNYSNKKFVPGENWQIDYILFWVFTIIISFVLYQLIEVPFMKMRDKN